MVPNISVRLPVRIYVSGHICAHRATLTFARSVNNSGGRAIRKLFAAGACTLSGCVDSEPNCAHNFVPPRQRTVHPVHEMGSAMTDTASLQTAVEAAWEASDDISPATTGETRDAIESALDLLDKGEARVAEKIDGEWQVNEWLKKAVLLSFRLNDMAPQSGGPQGASWWDKVPSKFAGMNEADFKAAGFRAVPNCIVRRSAYIAPSVVLMPSFVNLGAYVDSGTMIDTWATVGSCAQIGKDCHISGGAGIGGVLEPLQATPVIVEDNCFIGARSEVAEGVIVGEGSVLSMGVFIGASTRIVDRATGEIHLGKVPPYSVIVPGSMPGSATPANNTPPSLYCAVIVKTVDAQTRAKTSINELLRD